MSGIAFLTFSFVVDLCFAEDVTAAAVCSANALHEICMGQVVHCGFCGVHTVAPCSMSAWLKSPLRSGSRRSFASSLDVNMFSLKFLGSRCELENYQCSVTAAFDFGSTPIDLFHQLPISKCYKVKPWLTSADLTLSQHYHPPAPPFPHRLY